MRGETKMARKTAQYKELYERAKRMEETLIALYRNSEDLYYSKLDEHKLYQRQFKEKVGCLANTVDLSIKQCRELQEYLEDLARFKHGIKL